MAGDGSSRRLFLKYVGAGAAALGAGDLLAPLAGGGGVTYAAAAAGAAGNEPIGSVGAWVGDDGAPNWKPVLYPIPLPGDPGTAADDQTRLATYDVQDALRLPEGFRYDVLAKWGDAFGPEGKRIAFGYNADYTGLVKIADAADEYFLLVNHEYISARPWLQGYEKVRGRAHVPYSADPKEAGRGKLAGVALDGAFDLLHPGAQTKLTEQFVSAAQNLCRAALEDLGVSVLRVRRTPDGGFAVVTEASDHRRITGISRQNVTDPEPVRATGPAAPVASGAPGTFANCSGATTPWGTFLTCEENFQDQVMEWVTPEGEPLPGASKPLAGLSYDARTGLPFEFEGLGQGVDPPLDGRHFGWVCEVDPKTGVLTKHTALGRFRHENVALRVEAGKRLAAYMGDDRRGGHVWKFVSAEPVADANDARTAALLGEGTLYVARFDAGHTGRWVPLLPSTPLAKPEVGECVQGNMWLPNRPRGGHVVVGTRDYAARGASLEHWIQDVEAFAGKAFAQMTLADLVRGDNPQAVLMMDAYVMANCVGGTPCARPEDIEVHPLDRSVYVAFTDSTGSGDGSPDRRIFPDSASRNSRQYGAVYRIVEDGDDPAATTFTWGRFVPSGEPADGGAGFACADNLAFDGRGNLWMVCDISTPAHNKAVLRDADGVTRRGDKDFVGLFGNNAMFMIPTAGPRAGVPHCFAIGPTESELTGPTFTDDGRALVLSVQHPGEFHGTRRNGTFDDRDPDRRDTVVADRDGVLFLQHRTVPLGSNFPSIARGDVPLPCVVVIRHE